MSNTEIKPILNHNSKNTFGSNKNRYNFSSEKLPSINIKNTNPNDLINYTLKVREKLEQLKKEKYGMNQKEFDDKSIGRNKRIIKTKSC